jgi:hypothetical protein
MWDNRKGFWKSVKRFVYIGFNFSGDGFGDDE